MKTRMNGLPALLVASAMAATALLSAPTQAGGSIALPLPPLPPIPHIRLPAPPLMVWLPTPAVYVALDSPYPIFSHENRYYLHNNNGWYVGPGYAGPWVSVQVNLLPPGLRHYRGHEWRGYQTEARYWQHHDRGAHPHFYGHRMDEHGGGSASHSGWNNHQPRHENYRRDDHRWQADRQSPVHNGGRYQSHDERSARGYSHERGKDLAHTQYRGEGRGHGNKHWRMNY